MFSRVVRYEDFSVDPYNKTKDMFDFFGFKMGWDVMRYLDEHTKSNSGGVKSTFRDSKTAPFRWREKMSRYEVVRIQVFFLFVPSFEFLSSLSGQVQGGHGALGI